MIYCSVIFSIISLTIDVPIVKETVFEYTSISSIVADLLVFCYFHFSIGLNKIWRPEKFIGLYFVKGGPGCPYFRMIYALRHYRPGRCCRYIYDWLHDLLRDVVGYISWGHMGDQHSRTRGKSVWDFTFLRNVYIYWLHI